MLILAFIYDRRGAETGLVMFKNVVRRKEGSMDELELDYVIIKLKKKSSRPKAEKKS